MTDKDKKAIFLSYGFHATLAAAQLGERDAAGKALLELLRLRSNLADAVQHPACTTNDRTERAAIRSIIKSKLRVPAGTSEASIFESETRLGKKL